MALEDNEPLHGIEDMLDADLHKYLIALIGAGGEPVRGNLKLQKMLFLLSHYIPDLDEQIGYAPDYLGPYSEIIANESDYLKNIGMVSFDSNTMSLTAEGKLIEKKLIKGLDHKVLSQIKDCKELLNDLTSRELLAFIYSAYPDMAKQSVEYEKIKPNLEQLVISLIKKGKISSERGAELLDTTHLYIIQKLNKMETSPL